jgi:hypothetical protein
MRTPSTAEGASSSNRRRRDRRQLQPLLLHVDREGGGISSSDSPFSRSARKARNWSRGRSGASWTFSASESSSAMPLSRVDAAHRRGLGETLKKFSAEILAKDVVAIRDAPNLDELWPPFFV